MSHSIGKFVWFELVSHDIARAKVFYSELFGWKLGEMPMDFGPYTLFDAGQGPVAGAMAAHGGPSRWETYASVADVDAVAARVVAHGGRREGQTMDVPGVGRMAAVVDPTSGGFVRRIEVPSMTRSIFVSDWIPGPVTSMPAVRLRVEDRPDTRWLPVVVCARRTMESLNVQLVFSLVAPCST